jgi:hypothetical protein
VDSPFFPDFYALLSLPLPDDLVGSDDDDGDDEEDDDDEDNVGEREEADDMEGEEEEEEEEAEQECLTEEDKGKDKMDGDSSGDAQPSGAVVTMMEFIPRPFFVSRTQYGGAAAAQPSLVCVSLRMVDRGVPHYNALICLPTEDDLKLFQARTQHRQSYRAAGIKHQAARYRPQPVPRHAVEDDADDGVELDNVDEKGPLVSLHDHVRTPNSLQSLLRFLSPLLLFLTC